MATPTEDLRHPIGRFSFQAPSSAEQRAQWTNEIAEAPANLRAAVQGLNDAQLDTPYRPGGWSVRQVVHHVPESHMNAFIRFKLALTETDPLIKPYDEDAWVKLPDVAETPLEVSLSLLDNLHDRFVRMLRHMSASDFERQFRHPELGVVPLERNLALYAWHGKHHVAHITSLRTRMGW